MQWLRDDAYENRRSTEKIYRMALAERRMCFEQLTLVTYKVV
jgi:hypothetical protein